MNVVRMNTAHASREGFEALIANVRAVSNRIAILMDTKGPEVRTTANAEPIPYKIGEKVKIVGNPDLETTRECIAVSYSNFVSDLNIGGTILIDDGDLELEVIDKTDGYLLCEVKNDATLGSRKSVNACSKLTTRSIVEPSFRAIGASMTPDSGTAPQTMARYSRWSSLRDTWPFKMAELSRCFARTVSPVVSRSSRLAQRKV